MAVASSLDRRRGVSFLRLIAPLGVMLDTDERILTQAARIHQQTVVARVMPIGNLTAITEEERQIIDRWYRAMVEP